MTELYDHARKIVYEDRRQTGLWLGTGSTKTRISLALAQEPILVICPKITRDKKTFERELVKMKSQKDIRVMSKEDFRRDYESIGHYRTLIVDEADTCLGVTTQTKSVKKVESPKASQIFDAINSWAKKNGPERLYLLSATPTRTPMCVWGAAELLGKGWDYYKFRQTFYTQIKMDRHYIWIRKRDEQTKDRLAELVSRLGYIGRLEDWFDVPEATYKTDIVELTPEQKAAIRELPLTYPDPNVLRGKIRQVENGILIGNEFQDTVRYGSRKIERLLDYALEFPKMVIYAYYTEQINSIVEALRREKYEVMVVTGSTKDNSGTLHRANLAKECILVCQATISSSYELAGPTQEYPDYVKFNAMVFASVSNKWLDLTQAKGRIVRANALNKALYITLLVEGGSDEKCYNTVLNGEDFDERMHVLDKKQ